MVILVDTNIILDVIDSVFALASRHLRLGRL